MADFSFASLTTAVVGIASTVAFQIQSTDSYTIDSSNGTISAGNLDFSNLDKTRPGYLTGRRPVTGQAFPRGVYNK